MSDRSKEAIFKAVVTVLLSTGIGAAGKVISQLHHLENRIVGIETHRVMPSDIAEIKASVGEINVQLADLRGDIKTVRSEANNRDR